MSAQFGLDEWIVRDIREVLAAQPHVEGAWLFGSRARGDFRSGSDIDIAVRGRDFTFKDFLGLLSRLDDLPILFKMDVVHLDTLNDSAMRESIEKDSIPLWSPSTH